MKARDLMTGHPHVVMPGDPVSRAAEIMRDQDVGALPVVDDGARMRLRGVITDRDIAVRCTAAGHRPTCPVEAHMTAGPLDTVTPDADVRSVMELMKDARVRRLMVAEDGRLVGVIAQADLARREGPVDPVEVERVLERISEPAREAAHA
ncbi:MAG TPA: CBS domain-containing protein [Longimicrobium sp.]|nr:CBS domain-containing protein [Longimicrobium sp.]